MTSEEICVFRVGVSCLRAWAHPSCHCSFALVFDISWNHAMLSCSRHKWLLLGRIIDRRVIHSSGRPAAVVVVVIVVVMRRVVAHLSNWVVHLLSRWPSFSICRLLIRVPVNACRVIDGLVMVAVCRVVELVDNVFLVNLGAVAIFLSVLLGVMSVCSTVGVLVAWHELCRRPLRRAVRLARAALHLWYRGGSCLVTHVTVAAESRLVLLLNLHLFDDGHVWILLNMVGGDCGRLTLLGGRSRCTFDQIVLIYIWGRRTLLTGRRRATTCIALTDDLRRVTSLCILSSRYATLRTACRCTNTTSFSTASDFLYWTIQISAASGMQDDVIDIVLLDVVRDVSDHLAVVMILCCVYNRVLRVLAQLLLSVWRAYRLVMSRGLVDLLDLARVVFYVFKHLVRILWFWIFLVLLASRAGRWAGNLTLNRVLGSNIANCRLLACTLLVDRWASIVAVECASIARSLVHALNRSQ